VATHVVASLSGTQRLLVARDGAAAAAGSTRMALLAPHAGFDAGQRPGPHARGRDSS
jgi:hypothetical protein